MKRAWRVLSNILFVAIIVILIVPSWRVQFQGWFQSIFMGTESNPEIELAKKAQ